MVLTEKLIQHLSSWLEQPIPAIIVTNYTHQDFSSPGSEQIIEIHRGAKSDFPNIDYFWVKSLQSQEWQDLSQFFTYLLNSKYLELSEVNFNELIREYTIALKQTRHLPTHGKFITGLKTCDRWNEISAIAEFTQEYFAFYWSTTA